MFWLNDYLIHPQNTSQKLQNNHWLQSCWPLINIKYCLRVGFSHPPLKLKAVMFTKRHKRWELSQLKIHINFSWPSQNIFTQNNWGLDLWTEGAFCSLNRQREQFHQLWTLLMYIWVLNVLKGHRNWFVVFLRQNQQIIKVPCGSFKNNIKIRLKSWPYS